MRGSGVLRFDVDHPYHPRPLLSLVDDKFAEIGGRIVSHCATKYPARQPTQLHRRQSERTNPDLTGRVFGFENVRSGSNAASAAAQSHFRFASTKGPLPTSAADPFHGNNRH